jgi:hypothetical protein
MTRNNGIRCVLYSLGYGLYLVDQIHGMLVEDVTIYIKKLGIDVIETVPNPRNTDQAFIVTKHGRPPCELEKNQVSNSILFDLDIAVKKHSCYHLPKRLILLKQELGLKINLINDNN